VFNAGRNNFNKPWRVPVQTTELIFFFVATHANRIGTTNDLCFGTFATFGFGVATLGLDARQSMKSRY
jgi:hypothetical protein